MTDDRWEDTLEHIRERFHILEERTDPLPEHPQARRWSITFESPAGRVRLERERRPAVIDQRAVTSRRHGGSVRVEPIYDRDRLVDHLHAWRWDPDGAQWREFDASTFTG